MGYYRFDPDSCEFTRLVLTGHEFNIDEYSLVYTKGRSVYSADRNTGDILNKYTASVVMANTFLTMKSVRRKS